MSYEIKWNEGALEDLKDLGKTQSRKIIGKVEGYLAQDPVKLGKPLKGLFKGLYRYRCGDFRIIYAIDHDEREILIQTVGNRKDIYKFR